jgi:hypothetical protein
VIYLSGAIRPDMIGLHPRLGFMLTPLMGNAVPFETGLTWAADNGCFSKPDLFNEEAYLSWLDVRPKRTCLFATAPDVYGDHAATWARSQPVLPRIRSVGHRPALVAQNGMTSDGVDWDTFDALFLGGSQGPTGREWKMSAAAALLAHEARSRGKWVHMGRVNSSRRLRHAADIGCGSADGTYVAFGPHRNIPKVLRWLDSLAPARAQGRLFA